MVVSSRGGGIADALQLTGHMHAVVTDSDAFAQASAEIQAEVTDDLREHATGVSTAISLYRHCARTLSVHARICICEGLDIGGTPRYRPCTPAAAGTQTWPTTLN